MAFLQADWREGNYPVYSIRRGGFGMAASAPPDLWCYNPRSRKSTLENRFEAIAPNPPGGYSQSAVGSHRTAPAMLLWHCCSLSYYTCGWQRSIVENGMGKHGER